MAGSLIKGIRPSRKTTNRLRAIETPQGRGVWVEVFGGRKTTNRLRAIETSVGTGRRTSGRTSRKTTNRLRAIETMSDTHDPGHRPVVARQLIAFGRLKRTST